jgi:prolycopene isomerase
MQRYTLNNKGAAYGWAVIPNQVGANRIANKAPIEGLYFADGALCKTGDWC